MAKVFRKESANKLHVELSDGRMMPLKDIIMDYERLLNEVASKKEVISEAKDDKEDAKELKVGKWFRIDRNIIDKNRDEIYRKCIEEGTAGKELWERFEKSNKIANENPDQYPRIIETYIFKHDWKFVDEQGMRDMCKQVGKGICDEIICDFELQMRICNGELVHDLIQNPDKLPRVRFIKFSDGGTGYFGGGVDDNCANPPADLSRVSFNPDYVHDRKVPYAFRPVLS